MDILGLSTSPSSGGAYALVLNEREGKKRLPIIIGTFEAQAIALELEHIRPPRPMTHDLIRNILNDLSCTIKKVVINDLKEGTFFAKIYLTNDFNEIEIDARPSDAIALAIRFNSSIYVSNRVLNEAGIIADSNSEIVEESNDPLLSDVELEIDNNIKDVSSRIDSLKLELAKAIENEDYELAASIRDQLNKLED